MGLADKLEAGKGRKRPGVPLRVDVVLEGLKGKDRAKLEECLRDPDNYSASQLSALLEGDPETTICQGSITKWRRRHGIPIR